MLNEINCDKFKRKKIKFHKGLNTILGTNIGSNSIGKSTFLMIVDFVFGGNDYIKSTDIFKNIGHHDIYFSFSFEKIYYFCRSTSDYSYVWKCNSNYKKEKQIDLNDYCDWLFKKYKINLPYISFRDIVGRYIRVYGKDNLNENHPLHAVGAENGKKASYALLKLFDLYENLYDLEQQYKLSVDELSIYKKAQNHGIVDKITKSQVIKNEKEIEKISREIDELSYSLDKGLIDLDSEISEEAIRIKQFIAKIRRQRTRIKSKIDLIDDNLSYRFSTSSNSFEQLLKFFPNVNIKSIKEIEQFHKSISSVFRQEMESEKKELTQHLLDIENIIKDNDEQLRGLINNPKLSKAILSKHSYLNNRLVVLKNQNTNYFKLKNLQKVKGEKQKILNEFENKQFSLLENDLNKKMEEINNFIYSGICNPPIINFNTSGYTFFTPDDTGTGIAYKGLIVFDLAVLNLTQLPIIVHDSVLLKQIADQSIEKILELYNNNDKQIIISLDKQDTYTKKASEILHNNLVLQLGSNGEQLFGKSWG